jgi:hypothetical protein
MTDPQTKPDVTSLAQWKKAATHFPLCPSGARVGVRIPDLPALIEAGEVPQHLLDAALDVAGATGEAQKPTKELIVQQREFTDLLVLKTVVEPKLKPEDLDDIPYEDKEFFVALATRSRDVDAEGEHLAGLNKSEKFRRFRGIGEFDPTLASS